MLECMKLNVSITLEPETLKQIDRVVEALRRKNPRVTRSYVIEQMLRVSLKLVGDKPDVLLTTLERSFESLVSRSPRL